MGKGSSVAVSCGVICRCSLDPTLLLWLWPRLAAVALIRLVVWELPYTLGAALKKEKKKKTHRHREHTVVADGEGVGWTGSLGLVDANYSI